MRKRLLIVSLLVVNAFLVVALVRARPPLAVPVSAEQTSVAENGRKKRLGGSDAAVAAIHPVRSTPFASVYSIRPADFAANLRRVGCPEETVKDILSAEIGRRYRTREENLRPTPGDHLPWGWSPRTHEAKIIERRQQAAAIAREKEGLLRQALGYDVKVPMPNYAMTVSDQRFEAILEELPQEKRQAAHLANEQYWILVEQLRARTSGFWEREDVEELNRLKAERQNALEALQAQRAEAP